MGFDFEFSFSYVENEENYDLYRDEELNMECDEGEGEM